MDFFAVLFGLAGLHYTTDPMLELVERVRKNSSSPLWAKIFIML
jgi:hypothetical protein